MVFFDKDKGIRIGARHSEIVYLIKSVSAHEKSNLDSIFLLLIRFIRSKNESSRWLFLESKRGGTEVLFSFARICR
jgi:hypothetical protein